ncbi:immunity 42 family protein [Burkholderia ambifaria]|uniref:immunity 42 family protein n=1 Tax=Burkholderia ambifaria TaxID=152480 RepID=UPI00158BF2CB|nr:immunity 42 family protein [Burkholderia ambifaria]WDR86721.1 immunity 42 family protein [Burkholderia ambifaria]WDR99388.1 immunity 42 family protein [Burkholderia ambifaria]
MLIGNPDVFAIWCDSVESWSTDRFKNGCFSYFIGGNLIWSLNSTLGADINLLSSVNCLANDVEDKELFDLPASTSYAKLVEKAFPGMDSDAEFSDYTHLVSVGSLLDAGFQVFLVELGDRAKLIWGDEEDASVVHEFILTRGEFQRVVRDAICQFYG